ncbi:MAG TPA: hypothetical protein VJ596_00995 [Gemmatimonadaceae bacterium]|nr:hypothetical protein [Gemmatimonadaceae bacterium]
MTARLTIAALLLVVLLPLRAGAQDDRLSRLDARTRATVGSIVDSARAAGLPTEPLVDKALEGASKRAEGSRIAAAVRSLARELGAARTALGVASEAELVAAADALRAGADAAVLARLRAMRQTEALTIPLAVLSDLVARGVPADTAAGAVLALAGTGARDADFVTLRRNVERDIMAGAPPVVAASIRSKGLPSSLPPTQTRGAVGDAASPQTLEGTKRRP